MSAASRCSIGLDYGTNSCRAVVVDVDSGRELGSHVFDFPSGDAGILTDSSDPHVARQNPQDYLDGLEASVRGALAAAREGDGSFDPANVIGIGVDTTGSTPIPVDAECTPLALKPEFRDRLDAAVWLWKDHTAHAEAAEITERAAATHPEYLAKCGGTYSSEWWWSKILRLKRIAPDVFDAAHSFVEHCDWIPGVLAGVKDPAALKRSVCAAGHKAMFSPEWGGLPDRGFLASLDPALDELRDRLFDVAHSADERAGSLCPEWAERLGLPEGIAIAVGAFDAHMGAVGAGVREGTLVKILGTSTCDIMVHPADRKLRDIPGVCGIVKGSALPGFYGIEAGQSAVGDIFLWLVNRLVPDSYGANASEKFASMERELARLAPGETGLLALDWNNGNRTILVDVRLSGLILGQTLHTAAHEIYRALIEATAFGALAIIDRIEEFGVPIKEVVCTGGLAVKNAALMQIYADILNRPIKIAASDQTCALGAAIFGAAASGEFTLAEAQNRLARTRDKVFSPDPRRHEVYAELYQLYRTLHDAFGTREWSGNLAHVMKDLMAIRDRVRVRNAAPAS